MVVIVPKNMTPLVHVDVIVEQVRDKIFSVEEILNQNIIRYTPVSTVLLSDPECSVELLEKIAVQHCEMDARIAETIVHHPNVTLNIVRFVLMNTRKEFLLNRLATARGTSVDVLNIIVDKDIPYSNGAVSTNPNVTVEILEKIVSSPKMTPAQLKPIFRELQKVPKYLGWPVEWVEAANPVRDN